MKLFQLLIKLSLVLSWSLVTANLVRAQTGNMSDITGPNPGEMIPQPEPVDNSPPVPDTKPEVNNNSSNNGTDPDTVLDTNPSTVIENKPDSNSAPVVENKPDSNSESNPEPVVDRTPDSNSAPVVENKPDSNSAPVVENKPDSNSAPVVENKPDSNSAPVVENKPDSNPEPVVDRTPDSNSAPVVDRTPKGNSDSNPEPVVDSNSEPVVENQPDSNPAPVVENQPDSNSEPVVDRTPDSNSAPVVENKPDSNYDSNSEPVVDRTPDSTPKGNSDSNPNSNPEPVVDNNNNRDNFGSDKPESPTTKPEPDSEVVDNSDNGKVGTTENDRPTATETVKKPESSQTEASSSEEDSKKPVAEDASDSEEEPVAKDAKDSKETANSASEPSEPTPVPIDRDTYETYVQEATPSTGVELNEEFQAQLISNSGVRVYGKIPTAVDISTRLGQLWQQTGKKPAFINISLQSNRLDSFVVLPTVSETASNHSATVASTKLSRRDGLTPEQATIRHTLDITSRKDLLATVKKFRQEVSNSRKLGQKSYLASSEKLYQALIKPLEAELKANNIDILVFSMDSGLRLLPLAALYDGQQFLIEKYAVALVPSFGLTDTRYVNLNHSQILAMGASEFAEQTPLPTMPIELRNIISQPRQGEMFLNEQFTVDNFINQNSLGKEFRIVHLGTHADFQAGDAKDSYIQFYDRKVQLSELRAISNELGWGNTENTPVELLVLSACETAIGDEKAELGFAGLAVQAGVKSALASLWYVSDLGTLALMSEFYDQLDDTLIKAEALRQTQLQMLTGNVMVDDGKIRLSNGKYVSLPAEFPKGKLLLSHPYFWSSFTLIGNWN